MKVLYLVHSMSPLTGWGRMAHELVSGCRALGIEADVLSEKHSGFPGEKVILKKSWKALLSVWAVRKQLMKGQYDIVHSLEVNPYGVIGFLASLGLPVRHVISATGAYSVRPLYKFATSFIVSSAYKAASAVLCISQYIQDEILKKVFLNNTRVITLGVDVTKFSGTRHSREPFILSVGNLAHRKGYHVSVAAFAEIAGQFPELKYYIAGAVDEHIRDKCIALLKHRGLESRVVFLGPLDDVALKELYLSAELFVLTAINEDFHFEGFGLVFLEAASAGLPVIGTRGNGIASAVAEGKNGILVPQNDVQATAEALQRVLSDSSLKQRFSEGGMSWSRENSWARVVEQHIEVYNKVSHAR